MSVIWKPDRGWKRFARALDPTGFSRAQRKHIRKATKLNGLKAVAKIRAFIRQGDRYEANAELTKEIKGSSKPLVDKGHNLFQAVSHKVLDDYSVFVGVNFVDDFYGIAEALHNGVTIPVKPAMRAMFRALFWASQGTIDPSTLTGAAAELWKRKPGGWYPLAEDTKAITIPPRPFIREALEDAELKREVRQNWVNAVNAAIREVARKG